MCMRIPACVWVGVCVCVQSSGFFSGTELWLSFQMNQSMAIQFRLWGKGASIQAWGFPHMVIGFQKEKKKERKKTSPCTQTAPAADFTSCNSVEIFQILRFYHLMSEKSCQVNLWNISLSMEECNWAASDPVCVCVCVCVCPYVCVFRLTVKGILEVEWCTKSVERRKWTQTDTFALVGTEWCGHTSVRVENPSSSVKSSHFTHRCVTECSVTRGKGRETWGEMTEVWVSGKFSDQSSDCHTHTS